MSPGRRWGQALLLTALLLTVESRAQQRDDWLEAWEETADGEDELTEEAIDLMEELAERPLNLNTASREELERLPFLSAQQVMEILSYRDRMETIVTTDELKLVNTLDLRQQQLLPFFVTAAQTDSLRDRLTRKPPDRKTSHGLLLSGRMPCYLRRGDRNGYLGYRYRHWLRYELNGANGMRIGLVGAQDAGEPLFASGNRWGYDAYGLYAEWRKMGGVKQLVLGHYRLNAGMGLVLSNSFPTGKLAMLSSAGRQATVLRPHRTRSVATAFQGAAATIGLSRPMSLTLFASHRGVDATLNKAGEAQTLVADGYHRTPAEMEKKHNTRQTDAGLALDYRQGAWRTGLTAVYTHLNRPLSPLSSQPFRRYYPRGRNFLNVGLNYGYTTTRVALQGETALDARGHVATIHTLSHKTTDALSLMVLHRFYSMRYTSLHARAFSEGGRVQNEQGCLVGGTWKAHRQLQMAAYADLAWFPWMRYQASRESQARDFLAEAICQPHQDWTVSARYRLHQKERDNEAKSALATVTEHRARLSAAFAHGRWSARTQLDAAGIAHDGWEKGLMVSQHFSLKQRRWQVAATAGWFHTDSYQSRIYLSERQLPYEYASPMYYGHGLRLSLMATARLGQWLQLAAKAGHTRYFDRQTIGSGLQQIGQPHQTDIDLQLRLRL